MSARQSPQSTKAGSDLGHRKDSMVCTSLCDRPELLFRSPSGSRQHRVRYSRKILADFDPKARSLFLEVYKHIMNDSASQSESARDPVEVSIQIDPELLERIGHLTNDPSKVIETAIRQWLRGEKNREDELSRRLQRNPPVPPRGEWND